MKTSAIYLCTVVLWALVESRHAGRLGRSLDVEGKGSNLTQKQQQEVIHSDVLQHFTTTPTPAPEKPLKTTPSFIKEVPVIPEDINVQSLKNDDLHITYDRRITLENEHLHDRSPEEKNETVKSNTNDVISYKYNQTGLSSSTRSEVLLSHSSYEHSSTSVVYDDDNTENEENEEMYTPEHHTPVSSTETLKLDPEWKNFEAKKKDKSKKEIADSVTVPTDHSGLGRLEKPFKDNIINVKLKEKNKDSNSEALDERRSTTRFSSSSSISVSDHDNNNPLGSSLDLLKTDSSDTNNEESVNQSVNSVINGNGVNNESVKKPRVKYSVKKPQEAANDTESDNSSASGNLLNEDAAKNTVPVLNIEPQTTPSVHTGTTISDKLINRKHYPLYEREQPTESTPTKLDIFKSATSSPTTVVKPSIAFKQQLANKLKGLEPAPTAPMNSTDDVTEENQEKNKLSIKSSLRKKPRPEHFVSSSEMHVPPTATAWTLAAMKPGVDSLKPLQKPNSQSETTSTPTDMSSSTTVMPRQTTITPVSRVKSFVPWSTRLLKNSSLKPPTTASMSEMSSTETTPGHVDSQMSSSSELVQIMAELSTAQERSLPSSTTEEQSVIRTTLELDRNMTETSINIIPSALGDMMVKDQSSTASHEGSRIVGGTTTEILMVPRPELREENNPVNSSTSDNKATVRENVIETKQTFEENDTFGKTEEKPQEKVEEKTTPSSINNTVNEVVSVDLGESVNEVKTSVNQSTNSVPITTATPVLEIIENNKQKNSSDASELEPGTSDILGDVPGDESKSSEEIDEDFKPKQTTTVPPIFEVFETTVMSELDEDVESDNDREDEDLPIIIDKINVNQTVENPRRHNKTDAGIKPTTPSLSTPTDTSKNSTYVTSFDIVSKENTTLVVTKTPSEGDFNWYNVETKPGIGNTSVDETTHTTTPLETTTTSVIETTIESETTTGMSREETTVPIEITTETVTSASPTTTAATTQLAVTEEDGSSFESVDDPTSCVRIVVHVSPLKLCHGLQQLRESIASQLMTDSVTWAQVIIVGRRLQDCWRKEQSTVEEDLDVDVCFVEKNQEPSPVIRNEFLKLYTKRANDPSFPIVEVQMIMQPTAMTDGFDNVLAAIVLSVIAAICLVLLGILLVIIRKRQSRFNYGQRCTPVSLDDYSLDNISVYNSVRRKGALRASKRSYGNPGFEDPGAPTHPVNFAGLANFSNDREALDEEFSQIPMITVKPDELPPGAESKNRYANVIPLPETRVTLQMKDNTDPLADYINANYMKGPKGQEKLYIACQAPLQSTVEDFWRMIWQQQTKVILMLTALNENGVEKCADYLPQLEITDCHRLFGDFQVTLKKHEVREKYIISSLQLKNLETNLWREVTHLWYSSWPAQGVPEDGSAMIAFLIEARSYMRGAQGPTVVHCSPGTGRTGTVVAIDLCIRDFETLRSVDIPKTVYALRRDRAGAVQTKDQYAFIYQVLNLYATKLTGGALDSI